jgi:protein-disulfide reductase (glutathione)
MQSLALFRPASSLSTRRVALITLLNVMFLVVAFCTTGANADGFNAKKISWVPWEKALATAKRVDKPVMMLVHKTWCAACKQLRQKFIGSAEIEVLSEHFVMANVEDDDEPSDEKYSPQGGYSPRIMFLRPDGSVADVINPASDPGHLHFYGTADEVARGMLQTLRAVKGVSNADDL